ncbi:hypothetical protein RJB80_05205 [Staphylococcus hominis]|uniref:hypothetical protein n=1 Tax=Staphylococcus hominis TaxID=1290 RepID=UPI002879F184|nr:hypothetical protein [Staphylococcus hominis]MDS3887071.1 hypothetical protein [Staphylococcus hominis]MDS3887137.1 hypothetical protein [Staphylococcus hominis]
MSTIYGDYELMHPTKEYLVDEYVFKDGRKLTTIIYADNTVVTQEFDSNGKSLVNVINRDIEILEDDKKS